MSTFDELSTPVPVSEGSQVSGEVGPASGVVAGSNLAATGAGNGPGGVVPVPVAAPHEHDPIECACELTPEDAPGHPARRVPPVPVAAPCPSWCDAKHLPTWPVHSADLGEDIELGDDSALSLQVVDYGAGAGPVVALAVHTGGEDGEMLVIDLPLNQAFELRAVLEDAFDAIAADSVAVARAAAHRVDHNPETPAAPEVWSDAVAPGGYVCGALDPNRPDGICGMPVESEPCPEHIIETPGTGSADPIVPTPLPQPVADYVAPVIGPIPTADRPATVRRVRPAGTGSADPDGGQR